MKNEKKILAKNRKAYHDYQIIDSYEAGMVLTGPEVKSIKQGTSSLKESYAGIKDEEAYVYNLHIAPYEKSRLDEQESRRNRKLLLHKKEILKLHDKLAEKGLTLVPLQIYIKNGKIKLEIGLAKGKTLFDKRKTIIEKTVKREIDKEVRERQKNM